jgi:hypothetical protein
MMADPQMRRFDPFSAGTPSSAFEHEPVLEDFSVSDQIRILTNAFRSESIQAQRVCTFPGCDTLVYQARCATHLRDRQDAYLQVRRRARER